MSYRFKPGDKVRIHATPSSSLGVKEHADEVVTIKECYPYIYDTYRLEELPHLWDGKVFEEVNK